MERLEINVMTKSYDDQTRHNLNIQKALVCGFFLQVAHKEGEKGGTYITVKDNQVRFIPLRLGLSTDVHYYFFFVFD